MNKKASFDPRIIIIIGMLLIMLLLLRDAGFFDWLFS
jgi:preprotein translocase subunit Sec61beta